MQVPLPFIGLVLIGFGVLEAAAGPLLARMTGMPARTGRFFVVCGLVAIALGVVLVALGLYW